MEHDVYLCRWKRSAEGFELWIKSRPQIRAKGKTCSEAQAAFIDVIIASGGAFQPVMEFVPPLPQTDFDEKYSQPELYCIVGDDWFQTDEPRRVPFEPDEERAIRESWYDDFFTAPVCRDCFKPQGPRNARRLHLKHIRGSYDGGFGLLAGATISVFSENFLMLLSNEERSVLQFQIVDRPKKSRKQFFELIGPSGPPLVALAGQKAKGWRCEKCGACVFGYEYSPDKSISDFIAQADLPQSLPPFFTIGTAPNIKLCVTAARWASIVGKKGTRGITSTLLGVVPDDEVIRAPELKLRSE